MRCACKACEYHILLTASKGLTSPLKQSYLVDHEGGWQLGHVLHTPSKLHWSRQPYGLKSTQDQIYQPLDAQQAPGISVRRQTDKEPSCEIQV